MKSSQKWLDSTGGPFIIMPKVLSPFWEGILPPSPGRNIKAKFRWFQGISATDYDRACDIDEYLGVLTVASGYALVLGGEPLPTTWLPNETHSSGLIARWHYGESDETVQQHLLSVPDELFNVPVDLVVTFNSPTLFLFDSSLVGNDVIKGEEDYLKLELPAGEYEIRTVNYDPDKETSILLHKLSLSTDQ